MINTLIALLHLGKHWNGKIEPLFSDKRKVVLAVPDEAEPPAEHFSGKRADNDLAAKLPADAFRKEGNAETACNHFLNKVPL